MIGFLLNSPSPYDFFPSIGNANLVFPIFFGLAISMVISVPQASRSELMTITKGRVDVSARVWDKDDAAFINWRFTSNTRKTLYVRAPVHVLLMDILLDKYDPNDILGLGEDRAVFLHVQDERPYLRAARIVQMPRAVSDLLVPVLKRQIAHQHLPRQDLRDRVDASVNRYLRLHPSPAYDFASATTKGHAP